MSNDNELDSILKGSSPETEKKPEESAGAEPEHKLGELDAVFSKPPADFSDKPFDENASSESNVGSAALLGAPVGQAITSAFPVQEPNAPKIESAQTQANVNQKAAARQVGKLQEAKQVHVSSIDKSLLEMKNAQIKVEDAAKKLTEAREHALKLNAIPEVPALKEETKQLNAAKQLVGDLGIGIDEGAMRHNIKMGNIVDLNTVRKGITGTAEGTEGLGRLSGYQQAGRLIVPSDLANPQIYNQEQLAAQQALSQAQKDFDAAHGAHKSASAKWQGLTKATPKAITTAETNVTRATENAAKAADKVAELKALQPTAMQKVGSVLGKIPFMGALQGAMTAAEYTKMVEDLQKEHYFDAAMSGMSGTGGALMMLPHPYAKAAGAALSVPPLAYQGYQWLTEKPEK